MNPDVCWQNKVNNPHNLSDGKKLSRKVEEGGEEDVLSPSPIGDTAQEAATGEIGVSASCQGALT